MSPVAYKAHHLAGLFPPLEAEDLQRLTDDIAAHGLLEPVVLYENKILDGRNRYAACRKAKVEPDFVPFEGSDPLAFVISMNLHRRHLSTSQRAIIAAELSGPQQQGARHDLGKNAQVSRVEAAKLLNVSERTVKNAAALIEVAPEAAEEIKVGKADETVSGALKREKRKKREKELGGRREKREAEAREKLKELEEKPYDIEIADLKDWRPEEPWTPVASIITDPPYVGDSIPLYELLRDFAVDVLPDGAPLVVMTWQGILPDVIDALRHPELAYRWAIAWRYDNTANTTDHARRVFDCWKPILVYHKGEMPKKTRQFRDEILSPGPDKRFHKWGQSVEGMERLVTSFSEPDEIVCDPFLGGGATAVAAIQTARRFVGCDIDPKAVKTTEERLDGSSS